MPEIDPLRNPKATYLQVAEVIAARIDQGQYTRKLPGERVLAQELGVSYQTVRHATRLLQEQNLIISRQGRGTFVAASIPGENQP